MRIFLQDFRFAFRTLRKSPVFATVAVLSLALGIGANTAIFTLMDQVLLRMLPVEDPERLVMLDGPGPNQGSIRNDNAFSYPMYRDFRDRNQVFSGVLARYGVNLSLTYKDRTERVDGEIVSGNYFDVLGVKPYLGRTLTPEDDRTPEAHPVAVLTHGFWRRRFGGDSGILNQTIHVNGHAMTVVGVLAPGFRGVEVGSSADVMLPMMMKAHATPTWNDLENRRSMWLNIFARLAPGISRERAEAGMAVLYRQILEQELREIPTQSERFRKQFVEKQLHVLPGNTGRSQLREQFTTPLWVLMSMVGLVLLIACANVANLLIARAAGRQKEIAIRLALGAGRWQILRQLLSESLLLAFLGGAAGILVAAWTGDFLIAFLPFESAARSFSTAPDLRVLGYNFALSLAAGILFGLAPALQATRPSLANTLKDETGSVSSGTSAIRFRKTLVVAQIALSLLLLIGAGLFARSLYNLKSLDVGIRTENLMTFGIDPSLNGYTQPRIQELFRRLQNELGGLQGVRSVSMATTSLMTGDQSRSTIKAEGYRSKEGEDMNPNVNEVGPGFFSTLGIALVQGRQFTERDALTAPKVAIVNETAARYFFPGQNPVGKRIGFGRAKTPDMEVVGVVKDDRSISLREKAPRHVYVPYMQSPDLSGITFYVRTAQNPENVGNLLRGQVRNIDSSLPVSDMKTMEVQVDQFLFVDRLVATLSAFFEFLATLLAAVGLYGIMAYTVARRTREIGIRVALGAERRNVLWLVMKEVAVLSAIGVGLGLPSALGLSRFVQTQLYGIQPADAVTLVSATLLLCGVSLLAGYIPALRATRVDPLVALRYE